MAAHTCVALCGTPAPILGLEKESSCQYVRKKKKKTSLLCCLLLKGDLVHHLSITQISLLPHPKHIPFSLPPKEQQFLACLKSSATIPCVKK